nr:MAG TPA: hypothetical protein [Crassvirales sp.]
MLQHFPVRSLTLLVLGGILQTQRYNKKPSLPRT